MNWRRTFWAVGILVGALSRFTIAQTTESTSEPTTWPTTAPATEPATEPTEATTAPTTEPSTEPTTLPSTEATTQASTEPATEPTTEPATEPTTFPSTQPTTEPSTQPATKPATRPAKVAIPVPLAGVPEGTLFPDHVGRLVRAAKGREIDFVFEKDGKLMQVPVLPNLALMRMENAIAETGWQMGFHVSGQITEYKGRNYILVDHASRGDSK